MAEVSVHELIDSDDSLLHRVTSGETVTVTVGGRPVARLVPVSTPARWLTRESFVANAHRRADPALAHELRELLPDTTDDVDWLTGPS